MLANKTQDNQELRHTGGSGGRERESARNGNPECESAAAAAPPGAKGVGGPIAPHHITSPPTGSELKEEETSYSAFHSGHV